MTNSHFANASGWPNPGQLMSMHDLGMLAMHIIKTYPRVLPALRHQELRLQEPRRRPTRTTATRFWTSTSAPTGSRPAIPRNRATASSAAWCRAAAASSSPSTASSPSPTAPPRASASPTGRFRQFSMKTVVKAGTEVAKANVYLGDADQVALVPATDLQASRAGDDRQDAPGRGHRSTARSSPPSPRAKSSARSPSTSPACPTPMSISSRRATSPRAGFPKRLLTAARALAAKYLGGGA